MFIEERHQEILKIIQEYGRISIGEIQEKFEVSVDSARRDLRILEEKELLKRTHGGAIPIQKVGYSLPRHRDFKNMENMELYEHYAAIAKKATTFIKENDIAYLTNYPVGFAMLKYLPKDIRYTLVVNSASLADELKYWDNIMVYVTGGAMRLHSAASFVDSFATNFVKNMHFDLCLMAGSGYDTTFGFSSATNETAIFQRTVIENSRKKILLASHQHVGIKAFIKVCEADQFDIFITDWDTVADELTKIEEVGIEVIVANKE